MFILIQDSGLETSLLSVKYFRYTNRAYNIWSIIYCDILQSRRGK